MPFTSLYHRGKNVYAFAIKFPQNAVRDLVVRHPLHLLATDIGVGFTGPSEQQAQEIVDFRNRADRRSWVFGGCFLFNGDNGTQA